MFPYGYTAVSDAPFSEALAEKAPALRAELLRLGYVGLGFVEALHHDHGPRDVSEVFLSPCLDAFLDLSAEGGIPQVGLSTFLEDGTAVFSALGRPARTFRSRSAGLYSQVLENLSVEHLQAQHRALLAEVLVLRNTCRPRHDSMRLFLAGCARAVEAYSTWPRASGPAWTLSIVTFMLGVALLREAGASFLPIALAAVLLGPALISACHRLVIRLMLPRARPLAQLLSSLESDGRSSGSEPPRP